MDQPPSKSLETCEVCAAKVPELRRGRCWGCYSRWTENRPVGLGASCTICGERRRDFLRLVELLASWLPLCHNCAHRSMQLTPMPQTLDEIRGRLLRDRRGPDRRRGRADTRVFPRERRGIERRSVGLARGDDLMLLGDDDIEIIRDLEIEIGLDPEPGEETRIVPGASVATKPVD